MCPPSLNTLFILRSLVCALGLYRDMLNTPKFWVARTTGGGGVAMSSIALDGRRDSEVLWERSRGGCTDGAMVADVGVGVSACSVRRGIVSFSGRCMAFCGCVEEESVINACASISSSASGSVVIM